MARYFSERTLLDMRDKDMNFVYDLTDLEQYLAGIPTADVAPRAEFDRVARELERVEALYFAKDTQLENVKAEVAREIIAIIEQRLSNNANKRKGNGSEFWWGIYQGREEAYKDIKEIIEQKYLEGEK